MNNSSFKFTIFGSCLPAKLPDDFETFFKDGILIDRRDGSPMEMDAYYLYLALRVLEILSGRDYSQQRTRIIDALIKRLQTCNGLWWHGKWTGSDKEIHLRFTSSAIRLLVEAYLDGIINDTKLIIDTLKRHLHYSEPIKYGTWFYHDSLESPEVEIKYPFKFYRNNVWNSSSKNLLILNTHIDTLITILYLLNSISELSSSDRKFFKHTAEQGLNALEAVLNPPGNFFKKVFEFIDHHFREVIFRRINSEWVFDKWILSLMGPYYLNLRPFFKKTFPLFCFYDGYLERDISLRSYSFDYHIVNLWDIAKLSLLLKKQGSKKRSSLIKTLNCILERGINYVINSAYKNYVMKISTQHGGAMELCEAIIICFILGIKLKEWIDLYSSIRKIVPPSPGIMGYDPLIINRKLIGEVKEVHNLIGDREKFNIDVVVIARNRYLVINWGGCIELKVKGKYNSPCCGKGACFDANRIVLAPHSAIEISTVSGERVES